MKARVKETGEIVEVTKDYDLRESTIVEFYTNTEDPTDVFEKEELEFPYDSEFIDYWTRLEHQYAGMAMQSYVSNNVYLREIREMCKEPQEMRDLIADLSILLATTLIQKLKKKEERK